MLYIQFLSYWWGKSCDDGILPETVEVSTVRKGIIPFYCAYPQIVWFCNDVILYILSLLLIFSWSKIQIAINASLYISWILKIVYIFALSSKFNCIKVISGPIWRKNWNHQNLISQCNWSVLCIALSIIPPIIHLVLELF